MKAPARIRVGIIVWAGVVRVLAGASSGPAANVLLITVDTVRADHVGCYGYGKIKTPNVDELAREGFLFQHAVAQVPLTLPSHAVILTGTYPMYTQVRDFTSPALPANVGLISEAFQRHGYTTAAFVSAFVLDSSWGLSRGFATYDDQFNPRQFATRNPGNIQRRGSETVDRFVSWLSRSRSKPFFAWLHLYDPHSPYDPPEPFRHQYAGHLYDGEIAYADEQLGRVFKALKQDDRYDDTLIVFLSDHGESLGEHHEAEHGFFIYNATSRVPLIIKLPKKGQQAPRTIEAVVATVDVAPTIVQLLRLSDPLTGQFQGRSLAPLIYNQATREEPAVYSETYYPHNAFGWSALRRLTTRRYSFIDAPQPELYDKARDPEETHNVYTEHRAEANALRSQLSEIERRCSAQGPLSEHPPLSTDALEKLKSLGYVAYQAGSKETGDTGQADPKDKITTYNRILRATDLTQLGRYAEADQLLAQVAQSEPGLYIVPFERGQNALAWGKPQDAVAQFRACLERNPQFDQAALALGRAFFLLRDNPHAATAFELAVHLNPRDFLGRVALAKVYWGENQLQAAEAQLEQVVKLAPGFAEGHADYGIVLAKRSKYAPALPELEKGIALGYHEAIAYNYLGVAEAEVGKSGEAIRAYEKAVEIDPHYSAAYLNLALQYRNQGRSAEAHTYFRRVCELSQELCKQFAGQFPQTNPH
jgi:choline-sulfatase